MLFILISVVTLLTSNQAYNKILKGFIIICLQLSETLPSPLYIFDNNARFKKCLNDSFTRKTPTTNAELSNFALRLKKRNNSIYKELFN